MSSEADFAVGELDLVLGGVLRRRQEVGEGVEREDVRKRDESDCCFFFLG